ncbi:MAG: DUF2889 domain-containing protein [Ectothiorhodospiraceae bacterium]|nr:DUF2889 domain-containing protein [Chromatiales bacterium]MCP5154674.1 DUF2889 domain-containing protein [Ectothiorhodospiraceae bacterium]
MPLSPAAPREKLHLRDIECHGYRRDDGLWDIEGHLVDTKTYAFDNRYHGRIEPGTPVHEMWLRLTIDEDMVVHEAEAVTDHSPYPICPDITPRFALLKGLRIGPGWTREVQRRVGGVNGCTHLFELVRTVATTAFQTLVAARARKPVDESKPPRWIDTCHAHASDSPIVRDRWPRFYTGPDGVRVVTDEHEK